MRVVPAASRRLNQRKGIEAALRPESIARIEAGRKAALRSEVWSSQDWSGEEY